MKPLLTPDEARTLDAATQAAGTPAFTLMERAGGEVARSCLDLLGGAYGRRVVVACGKGNNGGDGFVAARHLSRAGARVSGFAEGPSGVAAGMRDRLIHGADGRPRPPAPGGMARGASRPGPRGA